jgi:thymidylate kinase
LEDNNINLVKIDLMTETAYMSFIPIVKKHTIEKNMVKYNNFYVVSNELEGCMHLLYPLVTFGIVKDKYKEKLVKLAENKLFVSNLSSVIGKDLTLVVCNLLSHRKWTEVEKLSFKIRNKIIFGFFIDIVTTNRFNKVFKFIYSCFYRLFSNNGLVVSFTGLDGVGKTTTKDKLIEDSEKYFIKAKTREFYWRPFLLPRPGYFVNNSVEPSEEYEKSGRRVYNESIKNTFLSYVKYFYYVLDFFLGRVKYLKSAKTGGLVIFDRYHFDNIIYPERFGFRVDKPLMCLIDKYIIPQPDILFYLTANTDELYDRKKEISINEIITQKKLYKEAMNGKHNVVEINTSNSFEVSYNQILLICLETLSNRYNDN